MSDDTEGYSAGGFIAGPQHRVKVERLGLDKHGHVLYSIDSGRPEHIVWPHATDHADQLACTETVADAYP